MIATLFVARGGVYYAPELAGLVDPWDEGRDARLYSGPWPVVAPPPCQRWGRYWHGGPSAKVRRTLGDDGGCFASALASVRRCGGVLEHPEASHAWRAFGLIPPPRSGGWVAAGDFLGWTCCVEQGHYGHRARKATWLYYVGAGAPPPLQWGPSPGLARLDQGFHSAEERARFRRGMAQQLSTSSEDRTWARDRFEAITGRRHFARLSARERAATPLEFRDLLIRIAAGARGPS